MTRKFGRSSNGPDPLNKWRYFLFGRFVYLHCDKATEKPTGGLEFETRGWIPSSLILQEIAAQIQEEVHIQSVIVKFVLEFEKCLMHI
jgi:hypothetical protein